MKIGIPKEIKNHEYRVGLTPASVKELTLQGHEVLVESNAGQGIGARDGDYEAMGACILTSAQSVYAQAEMIVKVKEPLPAEFDLIQENQILFTYLHLAADADLTKALLDKKCTSIAYETVTGKEGGLPLLAPMSEVAGRLSIQMGAVALQKANGGSGILLSGLPGVARGHVVLIGGGIVGINAALMAMGLGARVTIIDKSISRMRELDTQFGKQLTTLYSTQHAIESSLETADLVIASVLIPGSSAPKLITRDMLKLMRPGSVIVDVAIDQGGCVETAKPTTHDDPTYVVDDIVHYCVANMPSAVAQSSAAALNNATLPYVLNIANKGLIPAITQDPHLREGLNTYAGNVTHSAVADSLDYAHKKYESLFS